jgi:hypothetical protein
MNLLVCVSAALLGQAGISQVPPQWMYPGAKVIAGGAGIANAPGHASEHHAYSALTSDDLPTVVQFYANKAGGSMDISKGRPITLKLILFQCEDTSVVVLVSRAKGDRETHIAISYHRGRLEAKPPVPLGLTYPGTGYDVTRGFLPTHDDYDAVVRFCLEKAGAVRADGTLLENGGISSLERSVDVLDCTLRRPIRLKLIVVRWQAAVAAVVISHALDSDETHVSTDYRGPLRPGVPGAPGDPPDVIGDFKVAEWSYPGDCVTQQFVSHLPKDHEEFVPIRERAARLGWRTSTTADPFDKVVEHYSVLAGAGKYPPGAGGGNSEHSLLDFSHGRAVNLAVISRRYDMVVVTVVVSRAAGEERTQIALIYNRPAGP